MWKSREKLQIPEALSRDVYQVISSMKQALQQVRAARVAPASKSSKAERSERGTRGPLHQKQRDSPMPSSVSHASALSLSAGASGESDLFGGGGVGGCESIYLNAVRLLGLALLPCSTECTKDFKDIVETLFSFGLSAQLTATLSALASASGSLRKDIQVREPSSEGSAVGSFRTT